MKSRMKWLVAATVMLGMACGAQAQAAKGIAFQRAEHLKRGVNLSSFYAQTRDISAARLDAYMSEGDMRALKTAGFDHVRLSINPALLIASPKTGTLRDGPMASLDKTVGQLLDAGLNVVLDIHAEEDWKAALTHGDDGASNLYAFWLNFAAHYAKSDPDRVFFEILNEPSMDDLYRWEGIQDRAVAAIRRVAPRHTIIATAAAWGHQDGLLAMEPVRDDNVIYTFHDYDPMWFTHQGATWSTTSWAFTHGIPYPSTPQNILPELNQDAGRACASGAAAIRRRPVGSGAGADRSGCDCKVGRGTQCASLLRRVRRVQGPLRPEDEGGVDRRYADGAGVAARWLGDVDYDGNFGLATKSSAGIVFDQNILKALGMGK